MRELYALEQPESEVAVGVDVPGFGMLKMTLCQGASRAAVAVALDTSELAGGVEVHADPATALVWGQPLLGRTA